MCGRVTYYLLRIVGYTSDFFIFSDEFQNAFDNSFQELFVRLIIGLVLSHPIISEENVCGN